MKASLKATILIVFHILPFLSSRSILVNLNLNLNNFELEDSNSTSVSIKPRGFEPRAKGRSIKRERKETGGGKIFC